MNANIWKIGLFEPTELNNARCLKCSEESRKDVVIKRPKHSNKGLVAHLRSAKHAGSEFFIEYQKLEGQTEESRPSRKPPKSNKGGSSKENVPQNGPQRAIHIFAEVDEGGPDEMNAASLQDDNDKLEDNDEEKRRRDIGTQTCECETQPQFRDVGTQTNDDLLSTNQVQATKTVPTYQEMMNAGHKHPPGLNNCVIDKKMCGKTENANQPPGFKPRGQKTPDRVSKVSKPNEQKTPEHYWDVGYPSREEQIQRGYIQIATSPLFKNNSTKRRVSFDQTTHEQARVDKLRCQPKIMQKSNNSNSTPKFPTFDLFSSEEGEKCGGKAPRVVGHSKCKEMEAEDQHQVGPSTSSFSASSIADGSGSSSSNYHLPTRRFPSALSIFGEFMPPARRRRRGGGSLGRNYPMP